MDGGMNRNGLVVNTGCELCSSYCGLARDCIQFKVQMPVEERLAMERRVGKSDQRGKEGRAMGMGKKIDIMEHPMNIELVNKTE